MKDYLDEIEYAVNSTLASVWHEHDEIEKLKNEFDDLSRKVKVEYITTQQIADNAIDVDDIMLATGRHWENYFGDDKVRYHKDRDIARIQQRIGAIEFAIDSLCGTLLQYAKQGISIIHGDLDTCPDGRNVGSQKLKNVIWQSRNQSLHWESGALNRSVQACFNQLSTDFNSNFSDFNRKNLGFAIVTLLGWKTFRDFKADLLLLQ